MRTNEIRTAFLDYFAARHHAAIPSSSLMPENDPTTLFTGSGMQPLLPYLLGAQHPSGKRLVNSQKCFRAEDIEEIGDNRHTTFFEMLGNWSLGEYFKQEQLPWFFSFLTDRVGLDPAKLYVTVFAGDEKNGIPKDEEAVGLWKKLFAEKGIEAEDVMIGSEQDGYEKGMQGGRIFYYDARKNWWSRAGVPEKMPAGEPGGPDSEVFYDFGTAHDPRFGRECHPNCDCGRFMEIGNSVFMEYVKTEQGTFVMLPQRNVDFGGGLERIAAASNDSPDVFAIDVFRDMIALVEKKSGQSYVDNKKAFRVIADHLRGAFFMIADGVVPSNTDRGYIVRRLLRRAVRFADVIGFPAGTLAELAQPIATYYADAYPSINQDSGRIAAEITREEEKFRRTLAKGMRELEKIIKTGADMISGRDAFVLFTTYGMPFELTEELAKENGISVDGATYQQEMDKHQNLSRTASKEKFKGGLVDHGEKTTMLHTCTHLMLAGLRKYVGDHVHQAGSNITEERTRFDFTHGEKVSREALDQVESYVNEAIGKKCTVVVETMSKGEAQRIGVEGSFWEKYPDMVNVYAVKSADGIAYSRELCGGPHVKNTGDITGTFKIVKEESSGAGVRRIKAILE